MPGIFLRQCVSFLMLIFLAIDMVFGARDTEGTWLIAALNATIRRQTGRPDSQRSCGLIASVDAAALAPGRRDPRDSCAPYDRHISPCSLDSLAFLSGSSLVARHFHLPCRRSRCQFASSRPRSLIREGFLHDP